MNEIGLAFVLGIVVGIILCLAYIDLLNSGGGGNNNGVGDAV